MRPPSKSPTSLLRALKGVQWLGRKEPSSTAKKENLANLQVNGRTSLGYQSEISLELTTFRMNTCKSVSKQRTLTTFRINTYAKTGGRGSTPFRALHHARTSAAWRPSHGDRLCEDHCQKPCGFACLPNPCRVCRGCRLRRLR